MLGFVDSAIGQVRVISAAQTQFAKAHPELGYTCTLSHLPRSEEVTRLLARDRVDNGYAFEIIGCDFITRADVAYMDGSPRTYDVAIPLMFSGPAVRTGTYSTPAVQQDVYYRAYRFDGRRERRPARARPQDHRTNPVENEFQSDSASGETDCTYQGSLAFVVLTMVAFSSFPVALLTYITLPLTLTCPSFP